MKTLDDIYHFLLDHWPRINKNAADLAEYFPAKRKQAEKETANDLKKTTEHLLTDIHDESLDDQSRDRPMTVARTMARFAALLVVLSNQADIQTQRVIRLTRWLIRLTWALGFLTGGLLVATLVLLKVASHTDEQVRKIYEIAETQRHQNEKTNASAPKIDGVSRSPVTK
jgi:3-oxoacyl-(acyl-carrier-protein) synthase